MPQAIRLFLLVGNNNKKHIVVGLVTDHGIYFNSKRTIVNHIDIILKHFSQTFGRKCDNNNIHHCKTVLTYLFTTKHIH